MIALRPKEQQGHTRTEWLDSYHTFSFNRYYDPRYTGFGDLQIINDDWIKEGSGFSAHHHEEMEIITIVLQGILEHKDNLGNHSVIRPGHVQRMSAGTGIIHSEYNPSEVEPAHFLQIWILPEQKNLTPSYEQQMFPTDWIEGRLGLIVSKDGRENSIRIHQDAELYLAHLNMHKQVAYHLQPNRMAWLHVAAGKVCVDSDRLKQGDGAAIRDERAPVTFKSLEDDSRILLISLRKR